MNVRRRARLYGSQYHDGHVGISTWPYVEDGGKLADAGRSWTLVTGVHGATPLKCSRRLRRHLIDDLPDGVELKVRVHLLQLVDRVAGGHALAHLTVGL